MEGFKIVSRAGKPTVQWTIVFPKTKPRLDKLKESGAHTQGGWRNSIHRRGRTPAREAEYQAGQGLQKDTAGATIRLFSLLSDA